MKTIQDMSKKSIAFIGCGNMAYSLINGLVADGYDPARIWASDPDSDKLAAMAANSGVRITSDNNEAVSLADVVVLAVKPQILEQVAQGLVESVRKQKPLIISIAAGIREETIQRWLGGDVTLIRTMPNTPAMIQTGATVLHAGPGVSAADRDTAESILRSVGLTRWVEDEGLLDVVTALSGSGPAYFFLVMEALEEAAIKLGLPADSARLLTMQTALGAARMAIESKAGPATLRQHVTSPGGTTEKALQTLEDGELRKLFDQALQAACNRSIELSQLLDRSDGE